MLNERIIRDAEPEPKARVLWDNKVVGLGVKVFPTGRKSYVLSYRAGGRKRLATVARVGEIGLREARERAGRELVEIREGGDPLDRRRDVREAPTVEDGIARFFGEEAPRRVGMGRMSPRTVADYRKQARRYIEPRLGRLRVSAVRRRHVEAMLDGLPRVQRNRVLALASRLFSLFETWDWREPYSNPCKGIERAREEPRDRVLTPEEMAKLAAALADANARHPASVAAIRVAAMTGLRIGEVLGIGWEHVDFEAGRLELPETKTGARTHDLPAAAVAVMAALPRINEWVFTTGDYRDSALTYRTVRLHFSMIAAAAGVEDVRLHDLRRTVMTRAAASGIGTHVLRDLLGHKTTAMADRYIRAVGDPVREARERVGAEIVAMMEGSSAEVVRIGEHRG